MHTGLSASAIARDRLGEVLSRLKARVLVDKRFEVTRSVYGPDLCNDPTDKTFELCTGGYGSFISDAITTDVSLSLAVISRQFI